MILNALNLHAHIKNGLGSLYILVGKEIVLLEETVQTLKAAYVAHHGPVQSLSIWLEEAKDWDRLQGHTQQYGLFQEAVFLRAKYFKTSLDAKGKAVLSQCIEQHASEESSTCKQPGGLFVIEAPHLTPKALHVFFQNHPQCHLVEMPVLKDRALLEWIERRLRQEHLNYHRDVPRLMSQLTEGNALEAQQCIQQLTLLVPPSQCIEEKLLTQLLADSALFPLYTFADTCVQGNTSSMLRQLERLRHLETEPLLLLWWLTKIGRQLLQLQHGIKHQDNLDNLCKSLGIWSSQKNTYLKACKRIEPSLLQRTLLQCKKLDRLLKSSPPRFIWDELEQVALSYCEPTFMQQAGYA